MEIGAIQLKTFFRRIFWIIIQMIFLWVIASSSWGMHESVDCTSCHSYLGDKITEYSNEDMHFSKSQICLSCHDAGMDLSGLNPPFVLNGSSTLAGGSFTSTLFSDKTGHNIQSEDRVLGVTPPGGAPLTELTCLSCHDPHNNGNYRNLKKEINGHPTPVKALGDPNYQTNVYFSGMNEFCGACHFRFNGRASAGGVGGRKRHPVGITVSRAEHADIEWWSGLENKVTRVENPSGNPNDIYAARVFCLSCHRAHASPYKNALRWDYGKSPRGCLECHTF